MLSSLQPGRWPIAVKMAIDLLVAAVAPLAIAVAITSGRAVDALEGEARQNVELLARVTATQLDQLLTDTQRSLAALAEQPAVIDLCSADAAARASLLDAATEQLSIIVRSNRDFESSFLIDNAGIGIAATSPSNLGFDFGFREYFQRSRAGESHVSDVLVGKTSSRPGIYFSHPVRRDERIVGVAVIKFEGERMWEVVDGVRPGDRGHAILTDGDGIILAQPEKSTLYRSLRPLSPEEIRAIDPETRWGRSSIESANMPELALAVIGATAMGSVDFRAPIGATERAAREESEDFIAGFAPLSGRDWTVSVILPRAEFIAPMLELARSQGWTVGVILLLAAGYALWRARSIVQPVLALTHAAKRVAAGELDTQVSVRGHDEIAQLASGFNAMVPRLRQSMELRQSLAVAMEVQQSLLPSAPPTIAELELAGRSRYCDETGGDYFDFIEVSEIAPDRILLAVGDVMGHGIGSAFIMASARAALRSNVAEHNSLAALLTRVNGVLSADARAGRFMTLALLLVDPKRRLARWASAGHDPTIVYDPASDAFFELEGGDIPLGIDGSASFEEFASAVALPANAILFLGTDGIWETPGRDGELFGKDRLREIIRAHRDRPLADLVDAIERALRDYRDDRPIHDDVTFVAARFAGG
jgi:serine phosphatase RsbU (regulator of sigma subunit)